MNRSRYADTDLQDEAMHCKSLDVAQVLISCVEIVKRFQYRFHKPISL